MKDIQKFKHNLQQKQGSCYLRKKRIWNRTVMYRAMAVWIQCWWTLFKATQSQFQPLWKQCLYFRNWQFNGLFGLMMVQRMIILFSLLYLIVNSMRWVVLCVMFVVFMWIVCTCLLDCVDPRSKIDIHKLRPTVNFLKTTFNSDQEIWVVYHQVGSVRNRPHRYRALFSFGIIIGLGVPTCPHFKMSFVTLMIRPVLTCISNKLSLFLLLN